MLKYLWFLCISMPWKPTEFITVCSRYCAENPWSLSGWASRNATSILWCWCLTCNCVENTSQIWFHNEKGESWLTTNSCGDAHIFLGHTCCSRVLGAKTTWISHSHRSIHSRATCLCWWELIWLPNNILWPCLVDQRNQGTTQNILCMWSMVYKAFFFLNRADHSKDIRFSLHSPWKVFYTAA